MKESVAFAREKPSGGFELWSWVFMRLSGVVLLFLALGHLALMHLIHSVDQIDYWFVADRYAGVLWRGYDLAMLVVAMLHGINGARMLIDDYVHHPMWRRLVLGGLYAVCGGLLVLGAYVTLFFKPVAHG